MANLLTTTITGGVINKKGTGAASGTTITVDSATGSSFEIDLQTASGDISTFTINNPSSTYINSFILKITQGSTARQIIWS